MTRRGTRPMLCMTVLIVVGVIVLLCTQAAAQDKAVKELDGAYTVKAFERGGKAVPDDVKKGVSAVGIAGGKLTLVAGGKSLVATVKLNAAKTPAEIDLFPQGAEFEKGRRFLGVYQVKDGELTIVYVEDGERPKDLKGDSAGATKLVLVKK